MRILYINNYQGRQVVAQRAHRRNRTLGPNRKVELFTRGLLDRGCHVHVLSAATVAEGTLRWHSGFETQEVECGRAAVTYLPALDMPRANLLVASGLLDRFLRRVHGYDIVFLYNLEWYFLRPTVEFARREGIPLVVEYEDDALSLVGARLARWHLARGRRAIDLAQRSASGVVAVSPELARQLGNENSVVIPGLVGDDLLGIHRLDTQQSGSLALVYAGGIAMEKGPDILVKAVDRLPFPVTVDIVGTGKDLVAVRDLARRARARVTVHGEVDRNELVRLLARADVAVNAQRMTDGMVGQIFPFKVLEYIGAGLPVITSRVGEMPFGLRDTLVMYEEDTPEGLAEAIVRARNDMGRLRLAAVRARALVGAEYSSTGAGAKCDRVFRLAIDRGRSSAIQAEAES